MTTERPMPLAGIKVIDAATMIAAGGACTYLADFGAEVIKVEHPETGDPVRNFGKKKDGIGFLWKSLNRNKRYITLNLGKPEGQDVLKRLVKDADVLVENYRPGTFAKWGLAYSELKKINPSLIMLSVSGFGQSGPYSKMGGFGTIAEGLSGFTSVNGPADGPPTLPGLALADGVAGIAAALSIMIALRGREMDPEKRGQYIDISLCEPLMRLLEAHFLAYDQLGFIAHRAGNGSTNVAPRNAYKTREGDWVALSGSTQNIAMNVLCAVGRKDLCEDERFSTNAARVKNREELDAIIGGWIGAHSKEEVLKTFNEAKAVIGPMHNVAQTMEDPHFVERGSFIRVEDADLGPMRVCGMLARFSDTPGQVRWTAPLAKGIDNNAVFKELGLTEDQISGLREAGIISA